MKFNQIQWARVAARSTVFAVALGLVTSGVALAQGGCGAGGGGGGGMMGGGPPGGMGMSAGGGQAGGGNIMQMMQAAQQIQSQQMQALQAQRMQAIQLQQLRMQEQMQASLASTGSSSATSFSSARLSASDQNGRNSFAATMRRRLPGYGQPTARELREERFARRRAARLADRDG